MPDITDATFVLAVTDLDDACAFYRVRNGPTGIFTQSAPEPNRK